MKTKILVLLLALTAIFMIGCESDDNGVVVVDEFPQPPQGVYSVTGDGAVYIYWAAPYIDDIAAFSVYRSLNPTTGYTEIGTISADPNPDLDLVYYEYIDNTASNGQTYYYAVSSIDDAGQESELSAEDVFDTPRPQGVVTLYQMNFNPNGSGFILDTFPTVAAHNDPEVDIFIDTFLNVFNINAGNSSGTNNNVDIQDMGYTESIYDINYAPSNGWSVSGWAEVIVGHTYVIWDSDNFFAKMRVISIGANSINFEWAFQTDNGNPELAPQMQIEKPAQLGKVTQEQRASASE